MTYVVTQNCEGCRYTDCVAVCPVDAFHKGPKMLYINSEECIDCGACVPACPVEAIYEEEDVPENLRQYLDINVENCEKYEVISESIEPLPTAKTLEELTG